MMHDGRPFQNVTGAPDAEKTRDAAWIPALFTFLAKTTRVVTRAAAALTRRLGRARLNRQP
jgi:hypothetical protein